MKKMAFVFFILTLAVLIVNTDNVRSQQAEPIVIGAPIPRASTYGQNGERSMILAMEEINAAGGIKLGGQKRPIKLEIVDTRDEEPGVPTSEVLLAIEKLILDKKVKILAGGPCMSECCLAALDLFPKYKVLSIVNIGCWTPGWHAKTGKDIANYKYSFRLSGNVAYWIPNIVTLLNNIKEKYGFNKMYITVAEAAHCKAAAAAVEKGAVAGGWTDCRQRGPPSCHDRLLDDAARCQEIRSTGFVYLGSYARGFIHDQPVARYENTGCSHWFCWPNRGPSNVEANRAVRWLISLSLLERVELFPALK